MNAKDHPALQSEALRTAYEIDRLAAEIRNDHLRQGIRRIHSSLTATTAILALWMLAGLIWIAVNFHPLGLVAAAVLTLPLAARLAYLIYGYMNAANRSELQVAVAAVMQLPALPRKAVFDEIRGSIEAIVARMGASVPEVRWDAADTSARASVISGYGTTYMMVTAGLVSLHRRAREQAEAVLFHECAHIVQRDSDLIGHALGDGLALKALDRLGSSVAVGMLVFPTLPVMIAFRREVQMLRALLLCRSVAALVSEDLADLAAAAYAHPGSMQAYIREHLRDRGCPDTHFAPEWRARRLELACNRALECFFKVGSPRSEEQRQGGAG